MPYFKQTIDDKIVSKACTDDINKLDGDGWELIEGDPSEVDVYQEPQPEPYNGNTLKSWALNEIAEGRMSQDLLGHMAAFLDFANIATDESAANFRAYATMFNLSVTAETIITKAIEMNANITAVE